jgi:hypothetical protein
LILIGEFRRAAGGKDRIQHRHSLPIR